MSLGLLRVGGIYAEEADKACINMLQASCLKPLSLPKQQSTSSVTRGETFIS